MNKGSLSLLARMAHKELREILRDRRTIITLVLMPLLLYPLLGLGFRYFLLSLAPTGNTQFRIAIVREADELVFMELLGKLKREDPQITFIPVNNIEESLRAGDTDVGIELKGLDSHMDRLNPHQSIECVTQRMDDSPQGMKAEEFILDRLTIANIKILQQRLRKSSNVSEPALPIQVDTKLIKTQEGPKGSYLASLIPLVLVLMTITGAVYPSIDLTAGERERGTLEILMAAPVSRVALLLAKYVAVMTVAILTGVINLTMMTVTIAVSGMGKELFPDGLSIGMMASVLALLLLFAAFFSAVLLAVTSFARSFKEAQAYLIPLMLLAISPGLVSLMPGIRLESPFLMPIAPLINVVLLAREILAGGAPYGPGAVVVLSTFFYAFAAVTIASRLFGAEAVLYSEQGQFSDLFRRPIRQRAVATVNSAVLSLAIVFPLTVLIGSGFAQLPLTPEAILLVGMAASAALFVGVPAGAAYMGNVRPVSGFALRPSSVLPIAGAVLLGISLWPLVAQLIVWQEHLGLSTMPQILREKLGELAQQNREMSPLIVLMAMALVPAVVEEIFFRGWFFSALERSLEPLYAILITSILFGLFHLFTGGFLLAERLLPTTLLGIVLGFVRWRSGSVWPGILLHVLHNGLLVSAALFPITFGGLNKAVEGGGNVPLQWLLGGALIASIGAAIVWMTRPNSNHVKSSEMESTP